MAINLGRTGTSRAPAADTTVSTPAQNTPAVQKSDSAFSRYIGYNNEKDFADFLTSLYVDTKTKGLFFDKPVPNPANPEINKINSSVNIPDNPDRESVRNILDTLQSSAVLDISRIGTAGTPEKAADAFVSVLAEVDADSSSASRKSVLIKFLCWSLRYTTFEVTNILYIGDITRHEVYWLLLMSRLGCKVTYVNYTGEKTYRECDINGTYSVLYEGAVRTPLSINLGKINIAQYNQQCQANEQISAIMNTPDPLMIKYLPTEHEYIFKDILSTLELRRSKLVCTDSTIPVYFTAYIGLDDEATYSNSLFTAREELEAKGKQFLLLTELRKPSYQEAEEYYSISKTNDSAMIGQFAERIFINDNIGRTVLAKKAFVETLQSISSNNLFNTAGQLYTWFRQITSSFDFYKNDTPVIFYYGMITTVELSFLNMMARCGIDVFYFNPDKSVLQMVRAMNFENLTVIERKDSVSGMPFPDRLIKTKLATMAYDAERSLDNILYNDNTMFRTHQYSYSRNQTLKTTYDELNLMWHQQAMYRTGFDSKNNYVIVPNLFAKISGIPDGDLQEYYKSIEFKLAPMSVYVHRSPFFKPVNAVTRQSAEKICKGGKIDIEALSKSQLNNYTYLPDNVQYLIFSKMQEVIDSGFLSIPESDIVPLVLTAGLNIPNNLLQIIQKFDFTKDIPKIVIVSNGKQTFEAFECILLALFNMIGFDIIVFTPTGYKNLETFLRPEAFQEFVHGNFKYDFHPRELRPPKEIPQEKVSFFDRIFKGKK